MKVYSFSDFIGNKGNVGSKVYNKHLRNNEIPKEKIKIIKAIEKRGRMTMVEVEGEEGFVNSKNFIIL